MVRGVAAQLEANITVGLGERVRAWLGRPSLAALAGSLGAIAALVLGVAVIAVAVSHHDQSVRLETATDAGRIWARAERLAQTLRTTERTIDRYAHSPSPTLAHRFEEQSARTRAETERLVGFANAAGFNSGLIAALEANVGSYLGVYAPRVLAGDIDAATRMDRLGAAQEEADAALFALADISALGQQAVLDGRNAVSTHSLRTTVIFIAAGIITIILVLVLVGALAWRDPARVREVAGAQHGPDLSDPDELVAVVSHELRGPTTAVRGFIDMVLSEDAGELAPRQRRRLEVAQRNGARMERIIEDLRVISQAHGDAPLALETRPSDLRLLAGDAIELVRPEADRAQVRITCHGTSADANVDTTRVWQVLVNLLQNAIKYSPPSGLISVHVGAQGPWVRISVADQGPGVPADILPHVFDPFRTSGEHHGLGIGLAVSKQIVDAHAGRIKVESGGADGGSVFTVMLPAA